MILYIVRHASAGESLSNPKKDEKRPLDADGIEQCGIVGRALAALNVQPEVIVSSPLKRATQTASLIGNELGFEGVFRRLSQDAGKVFETGSNHGGRAQSEHYRIPGPDYYQVRQRGIDRFQKRRGRPG